jgi:molybdate transport system regulatory protein
MSQTSTMTKSIPAGLGRGRRWDHLELLERIDSCGSISGAASAMGMSSAAWQAVGEQHVRATGGRAPGRRPPWRRHQPDDHSQRVVGAYRRLEKEREKVLAALGQIMDDFEQYYQIVRRFDMKTSARNQFLGRVKSVKHGPVNAEVILDIGGGDELAAVITEDSAEHLALEPGAEAYALVKAPWVIVTTDESLKTSARNRLCGTVVRCQEGAINAEVVIELPGGKLVVATITNDSARELGLAEGRRACALIKASHVILAIPA